MKDQLSDGGTRLGQPGTFPRRVVEAVEGDGAAGADGAGTSHGFSVISHLHIFTSLHISDPAWVNHFNCFVLDR